MDQSTSSRNHSAQSHSQMGIASNNALVQKPASLTSKMESVKVMHPATAPQRFLKVLLTACLFNLNAAISIADDAEVLAAIKAAWQRRQDESKTVQAVWEVQRMEKSLESVIHPDPAPIPLVQRLVLQDEKLWLSFDSREWRASGWRTTTFTEAFQPEVGWQLLIQAETASVLPSLTMGRPQNIRFNDLSGRALFMAWFRPLDVNYSLIPFSAWTVSHQPGHADPRPGITTIQAELRPGLRAMLFLDDALGYLPVGSKTGQVSTGQQISQPEESVVTLDPASTENAPRPVSWQTQSHRPTGKIFVREICVLQNLTQESPSAPVSFTIEPPTNAVVSKSESVGTVNPYRVDANPRPDARPEHPIPLSYWFATVFAVTLIWTLWMNVRKNRPVS